MPLDLIYRIEIEDDGQKTFFLNDAPHEFADSSLIKIGDYVWFDKGAIERHGVVTNIRVLDFTYYDVGFADTLRIEEVAEFQVFEVLSR